MPIVSVIHAEANANASALANNLRDYFESDIRLLSRQSSCGFTSSNITNMNTAVSPIVTRAPTKPVALVIAITIARMHQADTSSTAAHANAVVARGDCVSCRSLMIRASTGNAVMLIAMPKNNAKGVNVEFGVASVG